MDRFSVTQAIQPKSTMASHPHALIGLIGNRLRCCTPLLYGARLGLLAGPILPADPHPALAERARTCVPCVSGRREKPVSWAESPLDINISVDGYGGSALPHTPIAQSETACRRRPRSLTDG